MFDSKIYLETEKSRRGIHAGGSLCREESE